MTEPHTESSDSSLWPLTILPDVQAAAEVAGKKNKSDEPCPLPLEELWRKYEIPLRSHLRRRFRSFPSIIRNWEDRLQDFALQKLFKEGWLKNWTPGERRFRDFLRMGLNNVVWDWWRAQSQYKSWEGARKKLWREKGHFSAIELTSARYAFVALDQSGAICADFQFADTAEGWTEFDARLSSFRRCPVAVQISIIATVRDSFLRRRHPIYPIEAKDAKRHNKQKIPAEITTEGRAAWTFANALRREGYAWSPLIPQPGDDIPCFGELLITELPDNLTTPQEDSEPFDLECAKAVLRTTLERVEKVCKDPKRDQPRYSNVWDIFRFRILDPIFKGIEPVPYKELIDQLALRSPTEATNMLVTAKNLFKHTLDSVVSEDPGSGPAKSELQRLVEFVDKLVAKEAEKKANKKRVAPEQ